MSHFCIWLLKKQLQKNNFILRIPWDSTKRWKTLCRTLNPCLLSNLSWQLLNGIIITDELPFNFTAYEKHRKLGITSVFMSAGERRSRWMKAGMGVNFLQCGLDPGIVGYRAAISIITITCPWIVLYYRKSQLQNDYCSSALAQNSVAYEYTH